MRDALIDALTRPDGDTLWHKDPKRTGIKVIEMGVRGFPRKIALLDHYDSRLQCGQCHVEYNCNPGYDPKNPDKSKYSITMADKRTNHFPYKDVFGIYDHYVNKVGFLDFKHALTGGLLWKAQHAESETFYNSKHAKAGASCDDCHTPKVKDKKTGKTYTSHFATTPRFQLKETCLTSKCHTSWTEEQARYTIDSVKAYFKGKMRKAEFWLAALIDKIGEAQKAGVASDIIKQAQDQHLKAHILWEWWTAENSDGFHNPDMARSLLQSPWMNLRKASSSERCHGLKNSGKIGGKRRRTVRSSWGGALCPAFSFILERAFSHGFSRIAADFEKLTMD